MDIWRRQLDIPDRQCGTRSLLITLFPSVHTFAIFHHDTWDLVHPIRVSQPYVLLSDFFDSGPSQSSFLVMMSRSQLSLWVPSARPHTRTGREGIPGTSSSNREISGFPSRRTQLLAGLLRLMDAGDDLLNRVAACVDEEKVTAHCGGR